MIFREIMRLRTISAMAILALFSFSGVAKDWVYVVSEGDNLWNISKKHLNKVSYYEDIRRLNNITHPKRMPPGTLVRIPLEWVKRHAASVQVQFVDGEHQIARDGKLIKLTQESELLLGDELRLNGQGSVTLKFADGSEMTLSDDIIISFDHLTQYGQTGMVDTRVRINQGKMEIRAEKQHGAGSRLDIASASAVTSVRGTVFRVGVDKSNPNASLVEVIEGEVAVSQEGKSVSLPEGFGIKLEKGKTLSAPVKLLEAPIFADSLVNISNAHYKMAWHGDPNSKNYQIQIAQQQNFSSIVWQKNTAQQQFNLPELKDGQYFVRVTAFDNQDIEGKPSERKINLNAYPIPPKLIEVDTIHSNGSQQLSWQLDSQSTRSPVVLQISKTQGFETTEIHTRLNDSSFRPSSDLSLGKYYWRVASLEANTDNTTGPFSEPSQFSYSVLLPAPILKGTIKDNRLVIHAENATEDQTLELQMSTTSDFTNIKRYRSNTDFSVPESTDPMRYIRARAGLKGEQHKSNWSKHCKITGQLMIVCGI
mgnify:CR=1 FL=1